MAQVARNLTDAASGFLKDACHLIVDRDPLYTAHFKEILASAHVQLLRVPARSPNLNAMPSVSSGRSSPSACVTSCRLASGIFEPSCVNTSSTITTSAITKASTTSSRCLSGRQARERSDATNASAAYWATIGGRPHSAADRVFGQDGGGQPPGHPGRDGANALDNRREHDSLLDDPAAPFKSCRKPFPERSCVRDE